MGPRFLGTNRTWSTIFEPLIRRAAGLGQAPTSADPDRYVSRYVYCDVLVVGAGPAGLAAALGAAATNARVLLCDEQAELGGSLLSETTATIDGKAAGEWIADTVAALARRGVRLLPRTQAFGFFHDNFVALSERVTDHLADPDSALPRERLWQVFAKEVVLATGAIERPLVFANNDRPGIMLAGAAHTYVERYGVTPGRRVALTGSHDSIYRTAAALVRHGVSIVGIFDQRPAPGSPLAELARQSGIPVTLGAAVVGTSGRLRVTSVSAATCVADGSGRDLGTVACDSLLISGGWTPSVHLFSQSRGKLKWDPIKQAFLPATSPARVSVAGACAGIEELRQVVASGFAAGDGAVRSAGFAASAARIFVIEKSQALTGGSLPDALAKHRSKGKAFVDFQNDVTSIDIDVATAEGFRSIEHLKRYTTAGMGTDQGKTSNMNALSIAADRMNAALPSVGLTTFRMPYTPVTFGTLAGHSRGDLFDPTRRTPIDGWAQQHGAVFEDVGQWKRARYFPRPGEDMHAAVDRECRTIRSAVGLLDASTLGKIEVVGPDAAEFLDRLYVNSFKNLKVGACRYGVLLNEAGFVIDDGVVGRMAENVFHVTTTTGGAARVLHTMEDYLQTEFTDLNCWLTSMTEQWAVIAVQGPNARAVLERLVEGVDLGNGSFPHMTVREGKIAGVPARIFRVSFTGELGFEINVPADYGRAVWELIWEQARNRDGCAYGTETMHVLRAEKGFMIVGQETDGTVTLDDLGLSWCAGKSKPDFVGKRSGQRLDMRKPARFQFIGLQTINPEIVLEEGAQITAGALPSQGERVLGHVTSSYWSATLGRSIALALVSGGRTRLGEHLHVPMPMGATEVVVVGPTFYDPEGKRLDV
jgi:sarcosine oxidase subunit alpha